MEGILKMKFEIEIDGVNAPIEDVETAIKDILYNQLDMELGADYKKFKVNVNHLNDKECGTMKKINEEIDIGWDLEARKHDNDERIRMRGNHDKWEKSTEITLNGRKTSVHYAKFLVKRFMSELDDDDSLMDIGSDLLTDLSNASPGDSFECPEIEKHLKGSFVPYYAKVAKESTKRNNKMKFKKIVKESEGGDAPRIYVGTYAKYNDGSIDGEWVDLTQFDSYEEFVDHCRELHSDEEDPEFMIQDYEGFPRKWYHEAGLPTEDEFDNINEFYMMDDSKKEAFEVFVNYTGLDSIEDFEEAYVGEFNSPEDFGSYAVDSYGFPDDAEYYIDYESFGRDLTMDWHQGDPDETDAEGEPEDPDYYYDSEGYQQMEYGSDREVGEQYIDDIGLDQLGHDTLDNYFDYEEYGRALLDSDFWEDSGYVFTEN